MPWKFYISQGLGRVRAHNSLPLAAPRHIARGTLHPSGRRPTSETTSSFPSPGQASAGSSRDNPAMPVVSDPLDEIRAILIRYATGDIGPPGADHEIMAILRKKGHVANNKIPPMLVGIHRLNRGGAIGTSKALEL